MYRNDDVRGWTEEYQKALVNSEWVNWTADCVLAHCAPSSGVMTHTEWPDVYPGMIVE